MTELEQYYNDSFKKKGMPEFKELSEKQVRALSNSLSFAVWKVGKAKENFVKAAEQTFRRPF